MLLFLLLLRRFVIINILLNIGSGMSPYQTRTAREGKDAELHAIAGQIGIKLCDLGVDGHDGVRL